MHKNGVKINSGSISTDVSSDENNDFISRLRDLSFRSLKRMYLPDSKLFVFCVRQTSDGIKPEGISKRYTAITLIGLAKEQDELPTSALTGLEPLVLLDHLKKDIANENNLGDVALTLWAAYALGDVNCETILNRLVELKPLEGAYPVVELSWVLDALCIDKETPTADLRDSLAHRIIASFEEASSVFPHVLGDNSMRSHVSCFADMVYPIHALSNYYKVSGDEKALDAAAKCAEKICQLQGEAGQWWWHYDRRTGKIIEGYPVYSVHQDAMAPMALFALKDAGGPDFSSKIQKGLDWLKHSPEINASLVDYENDIIWRKVARDEPGKFSRYAQSITSKIHPALRAPGINTMFPPRAVDYESRPYHLGWLLHAWPSDRATKW